MRLYMEGRTVDMGHKQTNHRGPKSTNVRYCPLATKMLRCRECPLCAKSRLMHRSKTASLFDHLVGAGDERGRHDETKCLGSLEVDEQLEFGGLIVRDVARFGPVEDLVHVIRKTLGEFAEVRRIGHQPAQVHVVAIGINYRETIFLGQFDDQGTVRQKATSFINDGSIYLLLRHLGEGAADLRIIHLRLEITNQCDPQVLPCFAKRQSQAAVPRGKRIRQQVGDLNRRGHRFLQDLQALGKDFDPRVNADARKIALRVREAREQSYRDRIPGNSDNRYRGGGRRERFYEIVEV